MKPNPLLSLNHFTVPVVRILVLPRCGCVRGARPAYVPITDVFVISALTMGSVPSGGWVAHDAEKRALVSQAPVFGTHACPRGTCVVGAQGNANDRNAQRSRLAHANAKNPAAWRPKT